MPLIIKSPNMSLEKHPRWNGGRFTDPTYGYVFIKSIDHPYSNDRGYIREHRLVMEKKLGRYLKPNEVVHHKNGKRDNNRISNLELCESISAHKLNHHRFVNKNNSFKKRQCPKCKKIKILNNNNFYISKYGTLGFRNYCKNCNKEISRIQSMKYYYNKKEGLNGKKSV